MSDSGSEQKKKPFKKKAHRPWKSSLLEDTVGDSTEFDDETVSEDSSLETKSFSSSLDSLYADFTLGDESSILDEKFCQLEAVNPKNFDISTANIKTAEFQAILKDTFEPKEKINLEPNNNQTSSISLGGFFRPQQLANGTSTTDSGDKMSLLMSDLKSKEQALSNLTSDLKISEALEKVELAEYAKRAEEQARISAERRMKKSVEQAHLAAEQFHVAMEQARQAEQAHQEEKRLRTLAETKVRQIQEQMEQDKLDLQKEKQEKKEAESKAQQALSQVVQSQLDKQKTQGELEQLYAKLEESSTKIRKAEKAREAEENSRADAENKYNNLNKLFTKIDSEHKENLGRVYELETSMKELTHKYEAALKQVSEICAQRDKLKTIVESEQELRKLAEKRMKDSLLRLEKSDKARREAESKKKQTDERAKLALAQASKTMMKFLNDSTIGEFDIDDDIPAEKPKVRVKARTSDDEDDFSF